MTIPAQNFTVRKSITTSTICTVGFPFTFTPFAPILPYQLFVAPSTRVIVISSSAFTIGRTGRISPTCSFPCLSNYPVWKRHFATSPRSIVLLFPGVGFMTFPESTSTLSMGLPLYDILIAVRIIPFIPEQ